MQVLYNFVRWQASKKYRIIVILAKSENGEKFDGEAGKFEKYFSAEPGEGS